MGKIQYPMELNFSAVVPKAWGAASMPSKSREMPTAFSVVAPCIPIMK